MFYNVLKNPNPPARSVPTSAELSRLSVRDVRDLLRSEGVDFSDCVEKSDLMRRAAMHLPGSYSKSDCMCISRRMARAHQFDHFYFSSRRKALWVLGLQGLGVWRWRRQPRERTLTTKSNSQHLLPSFDTSKPCILSSPTFLTFPFRSVPFRSVPFLSFPFLSFPFPFLSFPFLSLTFVSFPFRSFHFLSLTVFSVALALLPNPSFHTNIITPHLHLPCPANGYTLRNVRVVLHQ